jgi:predicted nucleotidyltransferase
MDKDVANKIICCAKKYPEIELIMLFGSQARGEAEESSDWDLGYIAAKNFDSTALYTDLILALRTDKVDLVNLSKANGLLRYRVTKDGKAVYEKRDGEYEKFWLQAVDFWCDAGPIIRAEYEALLRRIA